MSSIYEIVSRAGRIPLDELLLRSSLPPDFLTKELRLLEKKGLVSVKGEIPPPADLKKRGRNTIITLTSKGISANTA